MPELDLILLALLCVGFSAGLIDAIAGGGGLLTIPALLLAGMPPLTALGTNKLQSMFGSGSACLHYARAHQLDWRLWWPYAIVSGIAAMAGAGLAGLLPQIVLATLLPFFLIAVAVWFALWKSPAKTEIETPRIGRRAFGFSAVPAVGFYDGIFGPGTGSFFVLAFTTLRGQNLLRATAHTKLMNFASNIGGFAGFLALGAVNWRIGLAMGVTQFLGARLGAALAIRGGAWLIRPLLILICLATAIRLFSQADHPVGNLVRHLLA
ncbi:TSUP family transporter [Notoacmeibacter sp. MSK16QG-6]|uniref:TSUP family transporter n=1 Tax=Notoacmeibacter sp. MSK16QG-6 TaxID=2957982 RepID=UPI0020A1CBA9|nr:TSUP family transporter [Notoacmeibacter sp. MSK16QG-6]MCP1199608.1 TSUP family transporter [Notoacmeibacter sp. MSK16QG-6]